MQPCRRFEATCQPRRYWVILEVHSSVRIRDTHHDLPPQNASRFPLGRTCRHPAISAGVQTAAAKEPEAPLVQRGIVAKPPAGDRSVKIDGGYMVPYVEKIPDTDITFEMIPVPGGEFLLGSPADEADRNDDEGPQVRVKVRAVLDRQARSDLGRVSGLHEDVRRVQAVADASHRTRRRRGEPLPTLSCDSSKRTPGTASSKTDWNVDGVTSPTPLYDSSFTYGAAISPISRR